MILTKYLFFNFNLIEMEEYIWYTLNYIKKLLLNFNLFNTSIFIYIQENFREPYLYLSNDINNILNLNNLLLCNLVPIYNQNSNVKNLSSYLAGLIESDGSIIVPKENIKSYKPSFEIVFHMDDLGLAETLQSIIGGSIQIRGKNHCRLIIKKISEVLNLIHLINGKMRTPKIEALHRMINWCNINNYGIKPGFEIKLLSLDLNPIQNNSWLSGFIDGDGSFYLNWLYDKKDLPTSLQYYMRISQRQNYLHINEFYNINISYFYIMNKIALFLSVPLRSRTRVREQCRLEKSYEVRSAKYISNYTLLSYLIKYPLFSYKYREVPIQLELLKLSINKNYKSINGLKLLEELKLKSKDNNVQNATPITNTYDYFKHTSNNFPFY